MPLSERDRRTLTIGGVVIGVLLVALVLVNVLGGDDSPPGEVTARPTDETTLPPPTDSPTPPPTTTPGGPGGAAGRDPFSIPAAFSVAPTGGPTGGPTTPPTTGPTGGPTTPPTTGPTGGPTTPPPTGPPPTQPGNGSSTDMGGHEVVLLNVFQSGGQDRATVEVDGVVYTVSEGEAFGPNDRFELISASGNCAAFLFGDDSFTLCVNPQK